MKIVVVYIYPFNGANGRDNFGKRFVDTYGKFPSGEEHELIVVSNGEDPNEATQKLFGDIPNMRFFRHDNSGYDIGAYQHVSKETEADLMVFFSNSAYLRRPGWLKRMKETFDEGGDALYGSMTVTGALEAGIWPHVRTTGFWMSNNLFRQYPQQVKEPQQRYPFEHGPESLTMWCAHSGHGVVCVTFQGVYDMNHWGNVPDGYHNGEQKHLITGDRMSCPPHYPHT